MSNGTQSSGVQDLINRLREEGAAEGKARAEELVAEARKKAEAILDQARKEANEITTTAREEATRARAAGEEAIRLAVRDAVLALKAEVTEHFAARVRRLVSHTLQDEKFLERLILEVAGRAAPAGSGGNHEILLPPEVVGIADLRRSPEEVREGTLAHFVLSLAADVLRDGVTFGVGREDTHGIRVRLTNSDVEVDLTDRAVADLLLRHLSPRFRAVMEGVIQ